MHLIPWVGGMNGRDRSLVIVQGISDSSGCQRSLNQPVWPETVVCERPLEGAFSSMGFICPELALPYLCVMLSLDRQGEDDMSKHHAIYLRVSTKRQDTASQEP